MKPPRVPLICLAVVMGASCSQAAVSYDFSGLAPGASTGPMPLSVDFKPDSLLLTANWGLTGGWIQPSSGTPRVVESPPGSGIYVANQETYTVTIANVALKLWSTDSLITGIVSGADSGFTSKAGDPSYLSLGQFQYQVTLTMPAGAQGSDYPQIAFSAPETSPVIASKKAVFSLNTLHALSTSGFLVCFYDETDPDSQGLGSTSPMADGGKGVVSASINHQISGAVAVPEASASALLAGIGLAGLSVWRRRVRHADAIVARSGPARQRRDRRPDLSCTSEV